MEQLVIDGQPVVRTEDSPVQVLDIAVNDVLFGVPVRKIEDLGQQISRIRAWNDRAGFSLDISNHLFLPVTRTIPVLKGECKVCGRTAKYRDLCAAHYQAQRRAARSVPDARQEGEVELPFH